ncbi:hypothetical protein CHLRE_04g229948v5 [Chlamydomonas reinhardtii]|uniref:tRNA-dihydrouridine(47) synthase [NAD(P)(+)] n=1 Tax=Chlamydomonas reinhardtii TaxID=3055 RepID=A0A2K3DUZ8_CHLRE|nr:uncharacterized protein CHLRE_04g229948v5 [Chlamydomonas reinhardtii]PNW84334.1 hypothetical protein CHLRE_04g229948v5 [Chlamydomonas reinhardtii]
MLARNIVPVKAEYLIRKPALKPAAAGTEPTAAGANGAGAVQDPTAAGGKGSGEANAKPEEQSKSQGRKQMRKDVKAGRGADLCSNHALGRCTYGDTCRFSHDIGAFIRSKPADLPGSCPFLAATSECPYGVTCRYARSHTAPVSDDANHQLLATIPPPPPLALSAPLPSTATADEAAEAEAEAEAAGPLPLPVPAAGGMVKEQNVMKKEVQAQLWKNRYDFSKADGILKEMGLRISFKQSGGGGGGRGGDGGGRGGGGRDGGRGGRGGGRGGGRKGQQQQQQQQQEEKEKEDGAGEGKKQAGAERAPEAMEAEGAAGEAAAADVAEDDDTREAKRRRTEGSGGSEAAEGAKAAAAPAVAAGPAVAAAPSSDAAAVAALAASAEEEEAANAAANPAATAAAAAAADKAEGSTGVAALSSRVHPGERRKLDLRGKTYLAPLTTVGNLPFRRIVKGLGCDVTCGEMALATNLLQGQASEWALLKRHPCEDLFGVQVCGGYPDALARVGQLLSQECEAVDFMDINMGCPIDLVCDKNAGSALLRQPKRMEQIVRATAAALGEVPLTFKTRKGYNDGEDVAHTFLHRAGEWGAAAVTLHGRTRQQRYSRLADWDYIAQVGSNCAATGLQLIGNGDVFSYTDWNAHMGESGGHLAALMIGRGALIKPWLFTEIKEQRHWDISAGERLELYKQYAAAGLEHWGADSRGVENTRRFLLEWLSFTHRYVPVGLIEVLPQAMNHRPPAYRGRNPLESLLASDDPQDWLRISEMLLGPPPAPISFAAKHKSNSYASVPGGSSEADMARG